MQKRGLRPQKHASYGSQAYAHKVSARSSTRKTNQMPADLWLEIWKYLPIGHRIAASRVSQYWRALALGTPSLWCQLVLHISCDWERFNTNCGMNTSTLAAKRKQGLLTSIGAARAVIGRSGSCALGVQIAFNGTHGCLTPQRNAFLALLAPQIDRVVELDVKTDLRIRIPEFLRLFGSNFPRLQRLRVVEWVDTLTALPSGLDLSTPLTAPCLRDLAVDIGAPSDKAFWNKALLPNVTILRLVPNEFTSLWSTMRLCPALSEVHLDMSYFDFEEDEDDHDDIRCGILASTLRHLEVFNIGSTEWVQPSAVNLRQFLLQPERLSTSITMSDTCQLQEIYNVDNPTDIFKSYTTDDTNAAPASSMILSLEAGVPSTGEWSTRLNSRFSVVRICAQTSTDGQCYDPLLHRQRTLSLPDEEGSIMLFSEVWSRLDCSRVTRLSISVHNWSHHHLPLPKTDPDYDEPSEVTYLEFPTLNLLRVRALLQLVGGFSHPAFKHSSALKRVSWNRFVPSSCEVHFGVARIEEEHTFMLQLTRFSNLSEFEAWIDGNTGVGEKISETRWDD